MKGPAASDGAIAVFTTCRALVPQLRLAPSRTAPRRPPVAHQERSSRCSSTLESLSSTASSSFAESAPSSSVSSSMMALTGRQSEEGLSRHIHRAQCHDFTRLPRAARRCTRSTVGVKPASVKADDDTRLASPNSAEGVGRGRTRGQNLNVVHGNLFRRYTAGNFRGKPSI
jgi:hypothetical protein